MTSRVARALRELGPFGAPAAAVPRRRRAEPAASPLDLDAITAEAAEHAPGPFGFFSWLDARLVAAGDHPASDWWRAELRRFYDSGKRFGVFLVGRGAGKSTMLERVAVAEALFTARTIPPGQRWLWPFLSVGLDDARRRITEIATMLRAIGIDACPKVPGGRPTIELEDARGNAIAFVALAATISGVSGPSTLGATLDEEQKWRKEGRTINPASEVLGSLVQTFRSRAGIRAIRCSSAWDPQSVHALAVKDGNTLTNHVARIGPESLESARAGFLEVATWEEQHGNPGVATRIRTYAAGLTAETAAVPTWLGNPTITPVASREEVEALPTDARRGRAGVWLREIGSVLTAQAMGAGTTGDACTRALRATRGLATPRSGVLDPLGRPQPRRTL